jgi:drug/metabolite transporter (DMT)-like permease
MSTGYISYVASKDKNSTADREGIFPVIRAALFWWALSTIGDQIASKAVGPIPYLFVTMIIRSVILVILTRKFIKSYWLLFVSNAKTITFTALLKSVADALQNVSLLFIGPAVFSAIKRLQIVFGMFLGAKFLKEKPKLEILAAGVAGWFGVALMYLFR